MNTDQHGLRKVAVTAMSVALFFMLCGCVNSLHPYDTPSNQARSVGRDDFSNELMARNAFEPIVAAKQFEIRIADTAAQETNDRIACRPAWPGNLSNGSAAFFKVNRNHAG